MHVEGIQVDNFSIVLAICRTAMKQGSPTVTRNVARLRDALRKQGEDSQAMALSSLLEPSEQAASLVPSKVVLASTQFSERMSRSVQAPVDRETGAPLASIVHEPEAAIDGEPILEAGLRAGIDSLIEEWRHAESLAAAGVRPPRSLLMYGDPGTGKTALAHSIAGAMGLPLVSARLDGLISSFLGTTARNIASLFDFTNRYECILLLDEFDAVAKVRDDPHEVGEIKRVVNTLLQCLDGRRNTGFTIAITNHEHLLDTAIWRRFDTTIAIAKPDIVARRLIVERYASGIELDAVDVEFLTWVTDGMSGARIESICDSIKRFIIMNAVDRREMLPALKLNALLNADGTSTKMEMLQRDPEFLARKLASSSDYHFTQESLAKLLDTTQSTISRWMRKKVDDD